MKFHRVPRPTSVSKPVSVSKSGVIRIVGALLCAVTLALGSAAIVPHLATAAEASSAAKASASKRKKADLRLQIFLQRRFRLPDASDVELGPRKPSDIKGLYRRLVTVHNDAGQKARFIVFTDEDEKTAIISDVDIGKAKPGPMHGLWTRPLRPINGPPNAPARSALISESPNTAVVGSVLNLTKNPWGRINVSKLHLKDRAVLGPADAPVTIIEFADFECPYCARAFGEIETLVNTTYKGKVKLIFKNFPLDIHPWATQAAIAAECVRRQNPKDFWTFAGDIYRDQGQINVSNLRDHVMTYVHQLGLDPKTLDACIAAPSAEAQVERDRKDGDRIGVNSTPTFLIDGIEMVGLPTGKTFNYVLKSEIKKREAEKKKPEPKKK
jgi:protein-disulfide isomerase